MAKKFKLNELSAELSKLDEEEILNDYRDEVIENEMPELLSAVKNKYEDEQEMKKAFTGFTQVPIERLEESSMNHFSKMEDEDLEKWERFLCSIKNNGINVPLTVRPRNEGYSYEIISGHNRYRAAKQVGLETVPAIIKDLDDVQAAFEMDEDNEQRENVSPLERGWSYRSIYEAINRKHTNQHSSGNGFGHADQNQTADEKNGFGHADQKVADENELNGHADQKVKGHNSYEIIAEKKGIGEKTVRRYIRYTYLIDSWYKLFAEKKVTQDIILEVSHLRDNEQVLAFARYNNGGKFINMNIAKQLKEASGERELTPPEISQIFAAELAKIEIAEEATKKAKPKKIEQNEAWFPKTLKETQKKKYLDVVTDYIFENGLLDEIMKRMEEEK